MWEAQGDYHMRKAALPNKMEMGFTDTLTEVWRSSRRTNTPQHKFDTFLAKMGKRPIKKRPFPGKCNRWSIELVPMPANLRVALLNQVFPVLSPLKCCGLFLTDLLFSHIHTSMESPERSRVPCKELCIKPWLNQNPTLNPSPDVHQLKKEVLRPGRFCQVFRMDKTSVVIHTGPRAP